MSDEKSTAKSTHSGHRQRLRQRFASDGADSFEDHQLLELLLFGCIPRADTNEVAHALLREFGSLDRVFRAPMSALMKVEGIGEQTAAHIKAIEAVNVRRAVRLSLENNRFADTEDVIRYLTAHYSAKPNEAVLLLCFDNKRRLISRRCVSEGTANSTELNCRKVIEIALEASASYLILSHNHPNGSASPSLSDIDATRNLALMLRRLEIPLMDHIIIGGVGDAYSMRDDKAHCNIFL